MRLTARRRPNVARLQQRGNTRGLVRALVYEDPIIDRDGRFADLGTEIRHAAVEALADVRGEAAQRGLLKALDDPEPVVRAAAAQVLAGRPDEEPHAHDALLRGAVAWTSPPEEAARAAALDALEILGTAQSAAQAARLLLARGGDPAPADAALLRRLSASHGPHVLDQAILTLIDALAGDADGPQRLLAMLAPESVEALMNHLGSPRRAALAARALGSSHDSRAVGALCEVLRESPDPEARSAAAWALGEIRYPGAVEALLVASGDSDYGVRIAAAEAFDRLGNVAVAIAISLVAAHGRQTPVVQVSGRSSEDVLPRRGRPVPALSFRPPKRSSGGVWRRFAQRGGRP